MEVLQPYSPIAPSDEFYVRSGTNPAARPQSAKPSSGQKQNVSRNSSSRTFAFRSKHAGREDCPSLPFLLVFRVPIPVEARACNFDGINREIIHYIQVGLIGCFPHWTMDGGIIVLVLTIPHRLPSPRSCYAARIPGSDQAVVCAPGGSWRTYKSHISRGSEVMC
jgi:hypothetical protein